MTAPARKRDDEIEALREHALQQLDATLDRLAVEIGEPDLESGTCGECLKPARRRWTLGDFQLCRECRTRRAAVALKLAAAGDRGQQQELLDQLTDHVRHVGGRPSPTPPDDWGDDLLKEVDY